MSKTLLLGLQVLSSPSAVFPVHPKPFTIALLCYVMGSSDGIPTNVAWHGGLCFNGNDNTNHPCLFRPDIGLKSNQSVHGTLSVESNAHVDSFFISAWLATSSSHSANVSVILGNSAVGAQFGQSVTPDPGICTIFRAWKPCGPEEHWFSFNATVPADASYEISILWDDDQSSIIFNNIFGLSQLLANPGRPVPQTSGGSTSISSCTANSPAICTPESTSQEVSFTPFTTAVPALPTEFSQAEKRRNSTLLVVVLVPTLLALLLCAIGLAVYARGRRQRPSSTHMVTPEVDPDARPKASTREADSIVSPYSEQRHQSQSGDSDPASSMHAKKLILRASVASSTLPPEPTVELYTLGPDRSTALDPQGQAAGVLPGHSPAQNDVIARVHDGAHSADARSHLEERPPSYSTCIEVE